jgi:hypothetical protein
VLRFSKLSSGASPNRASTEQLDQDREDSIREAAPDKMVTLLITSFLQDIILASSIGEVKIDSSPFLCTIILTPT